MNKPSDKERSLLVNNRQLATILAALRFHQSENLQGDGEVLDQPTSQIATDAGRADPGEAIIAVTRR
jgi:hypothetical protein